MIAWRPFEYGSRKRKQELDKDSGVWACANEVRRSDEDRRLKAQSNEAGFVFPAREAQHFLFTRKSHEVDGRRQEHSRGRSDRSMLEVSHMHTLGRTEHLQAGSISKMGRPTKHIKGDADDSH